MTSLVAVVPATTVNVVVPGVSPVADAVIVTEPRLPPVTVLVAMPAAAVTLPVPVTVPEPAVICTATEVALSVVTTFLFASRIAAVVSGVAPAVDCAVDDVTVRCAAAPGLTVKVPLTPVSLPPVVLVAVIVTAAPDLVS